MLIHKFILVYIFFRILVSIIVFLSFLFYKNPVFESYQKNLKLPNQKSQSLLPMIPLPTLLPTEVRYRFFWVFGLIYLCIYLSFYWFFLFFTSCFLIPHVFCPCNPPHNEKYNLWEKRKREISSWKLQWDTVSHAGNPCIHTSLHESVHAKNKWPGICYTKNKWSGVCYTKNKWSGVCSTMMLSPH